MREVVETRALRRSDEVKTAVLRAVSHDLRSPLTAIVAAAEALGLAGARRATSGASWPRAIDDGERAARAPDRQAARALAAAGRRGRAAARLVLDRGGAARGGRRRPAPRRTRVQARRSTGPPADPRRRRPSSSARSRTCSRTRCATRAGSRCRSARARAAGGCSCASSTAGRGSRRPSRSASSSRSTAPDGGAAHGGSGLGLAIVQGVRRGQRRAACASSRCPGQGTSFVVELPLPERAPVRRGVSAGAPRCSSATTSRRSCARCASCCARPASTSCRRRRRRRRSTARRCSRPDAAIIDLVLPDGDGIEVCRALREWSRMPILVLSAVGDEEREGPRAGGRRRRLRDQAVRARASWSRACRRRCAARGDGRGRAGDRAPTAWRSTSRRARSAATAPRST